MTIIVRYGCDGCGRYFTDDADLKKVQVRQWRGGSGEPIYTTDHMEMLCQNCWDDRQPMYRGGLLVRG